MSSPYNPLIVWKCISVTFCAPSSLFAFYEVMLISPHFIRPCWTNTLTRLLTSNCSAAVFMTCTLRRSALSHPDHPVCSRTLNKSKPSASWEVSNITAVALWWFWMLFLERCVGSNPKYLPHWRVLEQDTESLISGLSVAAATLLMQTLLL